MGALSRVGFIYDFLLEYKGKSAVHGPEDRAQNAWRKEHRAERKEPKASSKGYGVSSKR